MTVDQSHALASISLTHVYFNPEDKLSYLLAYITLAPIAILVFYASVIVSRREVAGVLMLMGQLLNEGLNYLLKEHIAQERPHDHLGDGYGMPSSHSQFIWYFAIYGSLYMKRYIHLDHSVWKQLVSLAMFALAILVSFSRVYLGYHTTYQVVAGSLVGVIFGMAWYQLCQWSHSSGLIEAVLNTPLAKKLYLRDMSFVKNVARWEYEQWCQLQKESNSKQN